nr:hypothetical protein [uncultured Steroidobacter sp.]
MFELKHLNRALVAGVVGLTLSACGGGGGGSGSAAPPSSNQPPPNSGPPSNPPPGTPTASAFSGVAAVGAPLVGTVTVKDALGATRTVQIGTNGSYSVDVTGMTAPFVFRAAGTANGREYVVHSAAAAADVNGTINVTQLTDLVVNNIAGQIASNYFEAGNFGGIAKEALDAEAAKLKEKLLPVLQALGVDASVDLLRTQFTPLQSALDSALDILRVTVDANSLVATITNIVTQQQIEDDLKVSAAGEASPPQLTDTQGVSDAADDVTLIKGALANFSSLFADGVPPAANIEAVLTAGFLFEDQNAANFAAEMSSDPSADGLTFTDVDIKKIDYTDVSNVFAVVDFTAKDGEGREMDRIRGFQLRKGVDGVWRLHGDRKVIEMTADVMAIRSSSAYGTCTSTGLEFYMEDYDPSNNGSVPFTSVVVHGPGLPQAGIRYVRPELGGWWPLDGQTSNFYVMGSSCAETQPVSDAVIAGIPADAAYVAVAFDSEGNRVNLPGGINRPGTFAHGAYVLNIDNRPLTAAEAQASSAFPVITSPASAAELASYMGGDLSVVATGMNPNTYADVIFTIGTASDERQEADLWTHGSAEGVLNETITLFAPEEPITWRSLRVVTYDGFRRAFMTIYN